MAGYTTTGQAPGAVSGEPWVTSPIRFESREGTGEAKPLPKPPRVEVGQRWRFKTCVGVVEEVEPERVLVMDTKGAGWWTDHAYVLRAEYLGVGEKACTTGVSPSAFNVVTAVKPDPAAEARRALEATAKRLIDNPPAWAYPTGWMMAVLRLVERRIPADQLAREFSPRFCFYEELRLYQERRLAGQTHDAAKAGLNLPELCDAYARGMDIRAKPLLVRPVGNGRVRRWSGRATSTSASTRTPNSS